MKKNYKRLLILVFLSAVFYIVAVMSCLLLSDEEKQLLSQTPVDANKNGKITFFELVSYNGYLDLSNQGMLSIDFLAYMPQVEGLSLQNNRIGHIESLKNCKKLRYLDVSQNRISDFSVLSDLPNLKELDAFGNERANFEQVKKRVGIEVLDVGQCGLDNLDFLAFFPHLKKLYAVDNQIKTITLIQGLTQLKEVHLDANQLDPKTAEILLKSIPRYSIKDNPKSK